MNAVHEGRGEMQIIMAQGLVDRKIADLYATSQCPMVAEWLRTRQQTGPLAAARGLVGRTRISIGSRVRGPRVKLTPPVVFER